MLNCHRCDRLVSYIGDLYPSEVDSKIKLCKPCWNDDDKINLVSTSRIEAEVDLSWQMTQVIELLYAIARSVDNIPGR